MIGYKDLFQLVVLKFLLFRKVKLDYHLTPSTTVIISTYNKFSCEILACRVKEKVRATSQVSGRQSLCFMRLVL